MARVVPGSDCFNSAMAAGQTVDTSAVQEGMQRIQDYKESLIRSGQSAGMGEKLRLFAEREAERARVAAAMQHRHAALNVIVRNRLENAVDGYMRAGLNPRQAILAILEGSNKGVAGARSSVAAMNLAYEARYIGGMMAELAGERPHLVVALQDPKMDADVMREMGELREGGKPGVTGNKDAQYVAGVFAKYAELARTDLNKLGASIGKLDGWSGPQVHDDLKMIAAGKEAWIAKLYPENGPSMLDIDRTFPDLLPSEIRQVLGDIYDNITTGMPNRQRSQTGGPQRANPANLAKSLGKSRVLHFKDADAAMAYRSEFGHGNTVSGMVAHLRNSARMGANMEVLGPNPEMMIDSLAESVARKIRDASATAGEKAGRLAEYDRQIAALEADQTITPQQRKNLINRAMRRREQVEAAPMMTEAEKAKLLKNIGLEGGRVSGQIRQAVDIATGLASRPVGDGVTVAKIGNDIRAVQSMAKLGGATISSFSDVAVNAAAAVFRGSGFLKTLTDQLGSMMRGRPKGEAAQISYLLGEGFDGLIGHIVSPAVAHDGPVGKLSQMQNTFFKWNGLTWWTDVSRAAAGRIISAEMGMRAGSTYGRLPPAYRHVLGLHGIDAQRWDAIRAAGVRKVEGKSYITPDLIRQLDDATIAPLVQSRISAERASTAKRIEQLSARNEKELEWVAGRRQQLDDWTAEANARLDSLRGGNEVRSQIDIQRAQRRIEIEKEMIEQARRDLSGESLGARREQHRQNILDLQARVRDLERDFASRDTTLIDRDREAFQRRMRDLTEFVDRSQAREQGRLDEIARLENGLPERISSIIDDGRRDLELNVSRFFADETSYGVLEPDAKSRRFTTRAMRPGTFGGEAIRFVAQFKNFPVTFTQRVLGRALYGHRKDAGFLERFHHIGSMIAGTTIAGYMSMTAKDLMRGYWPPRDPSDPKVFMAAFVQGGSAGIYGDFLFSQVNRFGGGPLETLAGPTIGSVSDAIEIGLQARDAAIGLTTGQDAKMPAADALTWTLNNTPFVNLFYTRPVLDYLFINSLRDAVSPGYLKRQRSKRAQELGQRPLDPFGLGQTALGRQ